MNLKQILQYISSRPSACGMDLIQELKEAGVSEAQAFKLVTKARPECSFDCEMECPYQEG